jgi:hypothetical protein
LKAKIFDGVSLLAASWNGVSTSDHFQKARFCEILEYHHEEYDRNKSRHLGRYCGEDGSTIYV